MKKLSVILAIVLAVSMLAACCLAESKPDPFGKYDEPVTVHFVRSTDDTLDANFFSQHPDKTMTDNLWCDLYRDTLNVIVDYDWIVKGGDEYDQKLNIALGVGDIPEFVNVNTLQLKQLAEAGLIMPMEDIYEAYASDFTKEIMLATGTSPFDAATIDGHLYGLPNVDSTLMIADLLWIRTDWLEKLGLPIPTTMDEVMATAEAFAKADFDGNGVDDTIGIAIAKDLWGQLFSLRGFFNGFDSYPGIWVEDENGNLVYGSTLPGTKDALRTLHEMYEKGLIDPEFGVKDGGKVAEATTAGKCGLFYGAQWNSIYPLQSNVNLDKDAQWRAVSIVPATDKPLKAQTDVGTLSWTVVRSDVKHPEAVVKMFNVFIDKNWGPNNENGIYYAPLDSESIWKLSPVVPTNPNKNNDAFMVLEQYRKDGDESKVTGEAYSILEKLKAFESGSEEGFALWGWERIYGAEGAYGVLIDYQNKGMLQDNLFVGAPTETMTSRMSTLEDLQDEVFIKIILGESDIDAFDKFVDDFNALGGKEITEEVNEWYASVK
ncbi:MAG: extracellular solute-binding protein [Clostridia bacterium]|nr:extracellular solute-binding protein [Clostridia bacterium]